MATAQQLTDLNTSLTTAATAAQQANVTQSAVDTAQTTLDQANTANSAQLTALTTALADVEAKGGCGVFRACVSFRQGRLNRFVRSLHIR